MTFFVLLASIQPVVVGAMLAWAGAYKLAGRTVGVAASRSALPRLLGSHRRALAAYRLTGLIELVVALVLFGGGKTPSTVIVGLGFLCYLAYAKMVVPQSSCGCTSASTSPVGWRSFGRAAIVAVGGVLAMLPIAVPWWKGFGADPICAMFLATAESLLVLGLSPDFDRRWLRPARALRLKYGRHPLVDVPDTVPVAATAYNVERSEAFTPVAHLISSGLQDSWDAEGWRILTYAGRLDDREVTIVFAVGMTTDTVGIRVSVVEEQTGQIIPVEAFQPAG
ncbi:hypothetical protein GCM10009765_01400 [Fodinicola feengrottensis]|uniref:Methylamine utilization protein MauE n=1 Tax=Fodinicola feengrottensis TaxID=435914 RepID=A0ABN2FPL2_9ACTN